MTTDKVVSIFRKKEDVKIEEQNITDIFEEAFKRNKENQERLRKEREKDNKDVTKSYGLKK